MESDKCKVTGIMELPKIVGHVCRALLLVLPWLAMVALPIVLLPGFADSGQGGIAGLRIAAYEFVMLPLAPILFFRICLADPESTLALKFILFALGFVLPVALALGFVRFWQRRWFWLMWIVYFALLVVDALLAGALLKGFA